MYCRRGPPKDEDERWNLLFLSFWTIFTKKKREIPVNILLILVVLQYSWVSDVDIRLMIAEAYLEHSRTLTISVKKLHLRFLIVF